MPTTQPSRPPVDREAVEAALAGSGRRLRVLAESPSTNAEAARRVRAGEPPGLVLLAEHQTAGRGRLDRGWVTPARAALTFSVVLDPHSVPVARWPWLPLLTGLAVAEGVGRGAGVAATLKWPNDVLVDGLKVAGILVERVERPHHTARHTAQGAVAVVGIGLNVSSTVDELPVPTATSLALARASTLDRSAILVAVLRALASRYDDWVHAGGAGPRAAYVEACSTLGRRVRVDLPTGEPLHGRARGVDEDGRLQVVDDSGREHVLGAGDVVHVRPAGGGG